MVKISVVNIKIVKRIRTHAVEVITCEIKPERKNFFMNDCLLFRLAQTLAMHFMEVSEQ